MYFQHTLGLKGTGERKVIKREAVRAVILFEQKLLLIRTIRGDYKFPGGGRKKAEGLKEALAREVREETGYIVTAVKEEIFQRDAEGSNVFLPREICALREVIKYI